MYCNCAEIDVDQMLDCVVVSPCFEVGQILIVLLGFHLVTFYGWECFIMLIILIYFLNYESVVPTCMLHISQFSVWTIHGMFH